MPCPRTFFGGKGAPCGTYSVVGVGAAFAVAATARVSASSRPRYRPPCQPPSQPLSRCRCSVSVDGPGGPEVDSPAGGHNPANHRGQQQVPPPVPARVLEMRARRLASGHLLASRLIVELRAQGGDEAPGSAKSSFTLLADVWHQAHRPARSVRRRSCSKAIWTRTSNRRSADREAIPSPLPRLRGRSERCEAYRACVLRGRFGALESSKAPRREAYRGRPHRPPSLVDAPSSS